MHRFSLLKATRVTRLCSVWASHCGGFSCCGARAPGAWALVVEAHGLESRGSVVVVHERNISFMRLLQRPFGIA